MDEHGSTWYLLHHSDVCFLSHNFYCPTCSLEFPNKADLKNHQRTHRGKAKSRRKSTVERKFTCEVCSKLFPHKCVLRDHMVVHTGVKKFHCPLCSKSFGWRTSFIHDISDTCTKPSIPSSNSMKAPNCVRFRTLPS